MLPGTSSSLTTLSLTTFSIMTISLTALHAECHYAECDLCRVTLKLSVANKPLMLSVTMLNVVAHL
jgi:hypothetical protein